MPKGLFCFIVCLSLGVDASKKVMQDLTTTFVKTLDQCMVELNLPDSIIDDFYNIWREGHEFKTRSMGCTIHCLSQKLELMDPEGSLHHGNAHAFAKQHGADDSLAQQLVSLVHGCEGSTPANADVCLKVLDVANCFKAEITRLDWVPDMDLAIGELFAEI